MVSQQAITIILQINCDKNDVPQWLKDCVIQVEVIVRQNGNQVASLQDWFGLKSTIPDNQYKETSTQEITALDPEYVDSFVICLSVYDVTNTNKLTKTWAMNKTVTLGEKEPTQVQIDVEYFQGQIHYNFSITNKEGHKSNNSSFCIARRLFTKINNSPVIDHFG